MNDSKSIKSETQTASQTLEQRLKLDEMRTESESIKLLHGGIGGNRVMTFVPKSTNNEKQEMINEAKQSELKNHLKERKSLVRRAKGLKFSKKSFN